MTDTEQEAMNSLMDLVRDQARRVSGLENQLAICTKERDGLASWRDEHMDAMRANSEKLRHLLGARGGESPGDASRRITSERDGLERWKREHISDAERIAHLEGCIENYRNWDRLRGILGAGYKETTEDAVLRVTEERDGLACWQEEHMAAMSTHVAKLCLILGAQAGETPEDAARRAMKAFDSGRSPRDEELIRHLDFVIAETRAILGIKATNIDRMQNAARRIMKERDGLKSDLVEANRAMQNLSADLDGAKHYEDIVKNSHDILGRDDPGEGLEDRVRQVVAGQKILEEGANNFRQQRDSLAKQLYEARNEGWLKSLESNITETCHILGVQDTGKLQFTARRIRADLLVALDSAKHYETLANNVHNVLGRENLAEGVQDAARRVVAEREALEKSAGSFRQERDSLAGKLYATRNAMVDAWGVYTRLLKDDDEDARIKRNNDLDDAMGALDEVLKKGQDGWEEGEAIDAEWVQCKVTSEHYGRCTLFEGHYGGHKYDPKREVGDMVRCSAHKGSINDKNQCIEPEGHDGEHVFQPGRCKEYCDIQGPYYGIRCYLPEGHDGKHTFWGDPERVLYRCETPKEFYGDRCELPPDQGSDTKPNTKGESR